VIDPLNQNWYGDIIVTMATFDPTVRHPLAAGGGSARAESAQWHSRPMAASGSRSRITSAFRSGPTAACTLTMKVPTHVNNLTMPGYHQVESTGYFERWGYSPGTDAIKTGTGAFTVTLGTKGLFLVGFDWPLVEMFIEPDRTLGYPFEVRVSKSIFGVTAQGLSSGEHRAFIRPVAGRHRTQRARSSAGSRHPLPEPGVARFPPFTDAKDDGHLEAVPAQPTDPIAAGHCHLCGRRFAQSLGAAAHQRLTEQHLRVEQRHAFFQS
jgi:hypothetical protein